MSIAVNQTKRSSDYNISAFEAPSFQEHSSEASNPDCIEKRATQRHGNIHVDVTSGVTLREACTIKVDQHQYSRASNQYSPPTQDKLRESILDISHKRPVFLVGLVGGLLCLVAGYVNAVCIVLYTGGASHATGTTSKTAIAAVEQQVWLLQGNKHLSG